MPHNSGTIHAVQQVMDITAPRRPENDIIPLDRLPQMQDNGVVRINADVNAEIDAEIHADEIAAIIASMRFPTDTDIAINSNTHIGTRVPNETEMLSIYSDTTSFDDESSVDADAAVADI